jgi:hypothetical protein
MLSKMSMPTNTESEFLDDSMDEGTTIYPIYHLVKLLNLGEQLLLPMHLNQYYLVIMLLLVELLWIWI